MEKRNVGQGATEYLVLLAVVLIVALVSVALLGFFPGMASDAQITQSKAYWQSASPIAVVDNGGPVYYVDAGYQITSAYLKIRNNGMYPIRLSKVLSGTHSISRYRDTSTGYATPYLTDIYLAPGEETCLGRNFASGACVNHEIAYMLDTESLIDVYILNGAASKCGSDGKGTLVLNNFGFEYIEYIDGQQITKRQVGKPLVLKCAGTQ